MNPLVLAIDGPSGSGKSSTAKAIALRANWKYLDTGALYRAATWLALEKNFTSADEILKFLASTKITFNCNPKDPKVFVGETDVSSEIRSLKVTESVSHFSQMPELREFLVKMQREIIEEAVDIETVLVDRYLVVYLADCLM